jgi:hypothetical protein
MLQKHTSFVSPFRSVLQFWLQRTWATAIWTIWLLAFGAVQLLIFWDGVPLVSIYQHLLGHAVSSQQRVIPVLHLSYEQLRFLHAVLPTPNM